MPGYARGTNLGETAAELPQSASIASRAVQRNATKHRHIRGFQGLDFSSTYLSRFSAYGAESSSVLPCCLCAGLDEPEQALGVRRLHAGLACDFQRAGEKPIDLERFAGFEVLQHRGL